MAELLKSYSRFLTESAADSSRLSAGCDAITQNAKVPVKKPIKPQPREIGFLLYSKNSDTTTSHAPQRVQVQLRQSEEVEKLSAANLQQQQHIQELQRQLDDSRQLAVSLKQQNQLLTDKLVDLQRQLWQQQRSDRCGKQYLSIVDNIFGK